jgi:hypothetical protein
MCILGILRFKSIHLLFYTFIHMYISNDSNVILKYFHFILLVVTFRFTLLMLSNGPPSSIAIAHRWSWDSRFTKINNTVRAIFIYSFMLWCQCFNCWQSFKFNIYLSESWISWSSMSYCNWRRWSIAEHE